MCCHIKSFLRRYWIFCCKMINIPNLRVNLVIWTKAVFIVSIWPRVPLLHPLHHLVTYRNGKSQVPAAGTKESANSVALCCERHIVTPAAYLRVVERRLCIDSPAQARPPLRLPFNVYIHNREFYWRVGFTH